MTSRGAKEEKAIAQLARSTGTHWWAASESEQVAIELQTLGHGLFTYSILQGLSGHADTDSDGVLDVDDNCPSISNANQLDTDADTEGDACDTDDDNDGLTDTEENNLGTNPLLADSDGDGLSDLDEVNQGRNPTINEAAVLPVAIDAEAILPGTR